MEITSTEKKIRLYFSGDKSVEEAFVKEELSKEISENYIDNVGKPCIYLFGDCHTSGLEYIGDGINYSEIVKKVVKNKYNVINFGKTMLKIDSVLRFKDLFTPKNIEEGDIAFIWLGTNDLYYGVRPEEVFENFKKYYDYLENLGIKVVAITAMKRKDVPIIGEGKFEENRIAFNNLVLKNCKYNINIDRRISIKRPGVFEKKEEHFSPYGHEVMARIILRKITEFKYAK